MKAYDARVAVMQARSERPVRANERTANRALRQMLAYRCDREDQRMIVISGMIYFMYNFCTVNRVN